MSASKPKGPSVVYWLRASGQITDNEGRQLSDEWSRVKPGSADHKVYTTVPTSWEQFVASKYPREVLAYQAYPRVIGSI